ncbi:MAG: PAS domain S-box protein, partial [Desulfohalobiaceae bacterium]|nr:PAS domain S-box protein [Desulfohalobiaceae bacterium]
MKSEQRIRQRNQQEPAGTDTPYRLSFYQTAVAMAYGTSDGYMLEVNDPFCALLGYSREELLNMSFPEFTHPEDLDRDLEHYTKLTRGEVPSYSLEKRYIRKDGKSVQVILTVTAIHDQGGRIQHFFAVINDMSELRQTQAALLENEEKFSKAFFNRSDFLANMSHEFRTPLNGIMGMITLARLKSGDSRVKEYLDHASRSADQLLELVNNALDLSEIRTGRIAVHNRPFSL